jgi:hypothetical protein
VEEDGIALVTVELTPAFISDVEFWEDAAPVQEEGLVAVEGFVLAGCV